MINNTDTKYLTITKHLYRIHVIKHHLQLHTNVHVENAKAIMWSKLNPDKNKQ